MQKWQYKTVRLDYSRAHEAYLAHYVDGEEVKNWEKTQTGLNELLNTLGEDGWELVTVYKDISTMIFKRTGK